MLIGLHGKAESGKDSTWLFILDWSAKHGNRVARRDAFADRMKWSAARLFMPTVPRDIGREWGDLVKHEQFSVAVMDGDEIIHHITGRQLIQRYGTEAHRDIFGDSFWIDVVLDGYNEDDGTILVITDVRFENEAQAIKELGGEVWEIVRPGVEIADSDHRSEAELPVKYIDRVLVNSGDLFDLEAMVNTMMNMVTFA